MLTGTACLFGSAYHAQCAFSRLQSFIDFLAPRFDRLAFDIAAVAAAVDSTICESEGEASPVNQQAALRILIARDLRRVRDVLRSDSFKNRLAAEVPFEESLSATTAAAMALLADLGLNIETPRMFIVDTVPAPYDKADYKAIATDEDDFKQHGIPPGIYLLKKHLRPFYTRSLLLHELIHPVAAHPNPFLLGRGLEEGLAELVGSMYLTAKLMGRDLAVTIFTYTRLRYGFDQFWDLYLDYTRQATLLYNRFGLDGISAILRGGRDKIKEIEFLVGQGRLEEIDLPKGRWDDDLTYVSSLTTMAFCRNLVVSPLAMYLLPYVVAGGTSKSILASANVDTAQGVEALEELQSRVVLAIVSDDGSKVTLSDGPAVARLNLVRYEIPT